MTSSHAAREAGPDRVASVSVVIPLFDEADNLPELHARLRQTLDNLDRPSEIIFIDDGSTDQTYSLLREIHTADASVSVIQLRRNFGQTAAFSAGFDLAAGEVIVTMDGDLQNDPADIPLLLASIEEGHDIVSGWRIQRKDRFLTRRLPSILANALISAITGVKLHDYGCSLKAYRREVVKSIKLYGELHRFIPALASWMGIRIAEIPVNHSAREHGRSKYNLWRALRVILDLLTVKFLLGYSTRPIQIFGLLGMVSFSLGTLIGLYLTVLRTYLDQPLSNRPLLLLAILLVMLGIQLVTMGLLGELIMRTYHEGMDKPIYVAREVLARPTIEQ